ncbi:MULTISPECIES: chromate transporter [unclassified Massilia]|uniref:chromate transporter n=1 Tax=unclassified Massilia TaxID=2609279 RepID=UPI00177DD22F|nr:MULTISPECIES: chromate transporter [unclassified Massilia]MBD8529279.1 chromate transporter [Massilia sp. CFBP 13647]MBD8672673.1 chromate transporter [Massilia sp. CFBP 13721]
MSAHQIVLQWQDWLDLFWHFLMLSMMSLGGAISTSAEMHRYLVEQQGWLTHAQFNEAIALAQAAPGPNVLFVALMGWHVGLNAGSTTMALLGVAISMVGIMLPSTVFTYQVAQWGHRNRELRAVRAFKTGMAPLVIGMLLSTAWLLGTGGDGGGTWRLWVVSIACCLLIWRTRIHLLWLLGAGALLGAFGVV